MCGAGAVPERGTADGSGAYDGKMEVQVMIEHPRCADGDTEGLIRRMMMMMRDRY